MYSKKKIEKKEKEKENKEESERTFFRLKGEKIISEEYREEIVRATKNCDIYIYV